MKFIVKGKLDSDERRVVERAHVWRWLAFSDLAEKDAEMLSRRTNALETDEFTVAMIDVVLEQVYARISALGEASITEVRSQGVNEAGAYPALSVEKQLQVVLESRLAALSDVLAAEEVVKAVRGRLVGAERALLAWQAAQVEHARVEEA